MRTARWLFLIAVILGTARGSRSADLLDDPRGPDEPRPAFEERPRIERGLEEISARVAALRASRTPGADLAVDAEIFAKGIAWALRYDPTLTPADQALLKKAVERGRGRVQALEAGQHPWTTRKGRVVRGFTSAIDGSVQPYAVIVPESYDPARPVRLDVVLHGSTRPVGMSELKFLARFDDGDGEPVKAPTDHDWIELHPLGRVENGYRWAGETDVFEAIEAVCRSYAIDRDRIVLRGMSMGASGTWHLGLKHPDRFVALGPYCGYVDTHRFSETPLATFVKVDTLPPHQESMLHLLDSVDYAANAGVVPAVACMGEKDVFFQAHVLMGQAMEKEGLTMTNLISPGTGHVIDPATHKEQMKRIEAYAARGVDRLPSHLRFVTWSLKYSRCHWLQVLGLQEHYARAELEAHVGADGTVDVAEPKNITRFALLRPVRHLRIGGRDVALSGPGGSSPDTALVLGRRDGGWTCLGTLDTVPLDGKRPGLQGPIDDAFTAPFLCVRGTGKAWNPNVQAWADARLEQFAREWNRYFRGDLPIKDDTDVTPEDVRTRNLILFGDPGSNGWIARVLPHLPIEWTRQGCSIGQARVPASSHAPVLIQASPLASGRYVVLNSGHTFHEKELSTLNYLLFPRVGDWALVRVGRPAAGSPSQAATDEVVHDGFFDERWQAGVSPDRGLASFFLPPARYADDLGGLRSPLRFADGSPVKTEADWNRRRRETLETWHSAMGAWPPVIDSPRLEYLEKEQRDGFTQHHVRLEIAPGRTTDDAYLLVPDGDGPCPAMVVVFYDAKSGIGRGKAGLRDFASQLARRGFVTISLGSDPSTFYPDKDKPQLQPLSFHAYVAANAYQALAGLPRVDPKRVGVMGHSYGGKWALFASCLFDKFACGVWSDPGVVFDESRSNVNYWEPWYLGWEAGTTRKRGVLTAESPRTGPYKRLIESGHDLHELHALMAPRPFLVSGGAEDQPSRWAALNHAVAVNRFLGYEHRVAMTNRPGHSPTVESNDQIYRFLEDVLGPGAAANPIHQPPSDPEKNAPSRPTDREKGS